MTLDPTILSNLTLIGTAFAGAFLAALWLSLIFWTVRDIRSRTRDRLMRILAVIVVAVLNLPGIIVYLILRPAKTLDEEYQRTLEEEALLQSLEDTAQCPGCGRNIKENWVVCPSCHTKLKKLCHKCGKNLELSWNICPYCTAVVPGTERQEES